MNERLARSCVYKFLDPFKRWDKLKKKNANSRGKFHLVGWIKRISSYGTSSRKIRMWNCILGSLVIRIKRAIDGLLRFYFRRTELNRLNTLECRCNRAHPVTRIIMAQWYNFIGERLRKVGPDNDELNSVGPNFKMEFKRGCQTLDNGGHTISSFCSSNFRQLSKIV